MSCGLPCVASDVGGNRAILAGRGAGLLFDPGDAGAPRRPRSSACSRTKRSRATSAERARAEVDERYDPSAALVALEIALLKQVASAAGRARARSG